MLSLNTLCHCLYNLCHQNSVRSFSLLSCWCYLRGEVFQGVQWHRGCSWPNNRSRWLGSPDCYSYFQLARASSCVFEQRGLNQSSGGKMGSKDCGHLMASSYSDLGSTTESIIPQGALPSSQLQWNARPGQFLWVVSEHCWVHQGAAVLSGTFPLIPESFLVVNPLPRSRISFALLILP